MEAETWTQVGHHLLMLMLYAILNTNNPLFHVILKEIHPMLETLKLRSEPSLILIHPILHKIKLCVIDHYKLFHASVKRANLG